MFIIVVNTVSTVSEELVAEKLRINCYATNNGCRSVGKGLEELFTSDLRLRGLR